MSGTRQVTPWPWNLFYPLSLVLLCSYTPLPRALVILFCAFLSAPASCPLSAWGPRWSQERQDAGTVGAGCGPSTGSGGGHLVLDALPAAQVTLGKSRASLGQVAGMAPRISHRSVHILLEPAMEGELSPHPPAPNLSAGGGTHKQGVLRGTIVLGPEAGRLPSL